MGSLHAQDSRTSSRTSTNSLLESREPGMAVSACMRCSDTSRDLPCFVQQRKRVHAARHALAVPGCHLSSPASTFHCAPRHAAHRPYVPHRVAHRRRVHHDVRERTSGRAGCAGVEPGRVGARVPAGRARRPPIRCAAVRLTMDRVSVRVDISACNKQGM